MQCMNDVGTYKAIDYGWKSGPLPISTLEIDNLGLAVGTIVMSPVVTRWKVWVHHPLAGQTSRLNTPAAQFLDDHL